MNKPKTITLTPFLTVGSGKKAIDFYVNAWKATILTQHDRENNGIMAKISIAGADFWIGDQEPEFGNICPNGTTNSPVRIILETKNADELFEQALLFGATTICPMTTEDSWRIGKLIDPFGHIWELGYELD
ncbi:MAG: VOC family protein [Saprospiraceae bacterium]|nr:VOC family protein [Saprospiraceae bacterium]